jgi:hypothetical protein
MGASILEFRFAIPVLARSSGEVIGGLLRLKTARKMGSWPSGNPVQNHTKAGTRYSFLGTLGMAALRGRVVTR